MREVRRSQIGESLVQLLAEEHPLEEDIGILDEEGNLLGVVITPRAYDFFCGRPRRQRTRWTISPWITSADQETSHERKRPGVTPNCLRNTAMKALGLS